MSETAPSPTVGQISPDGQSVWNGTGWSPNPNLPKAKKSHTFRNVFLGFLAAMVVVIGGCMALVGGAANEVDKAIKTEEKKDKLPGGPDNPMPITEGKAFDVQGFAYQAGWKVEKDSIELVGLKNFKVINNRKEADNLWVSVKFWKGSEVLATVDCTNEDIAVGTTVSPSCGSLDKFPTGYDKITIQDSI